MREINHWQNQRLRMQDEISPGKVSRVPLGNIDRFLDDLTNRPRRRQVELAAMKELSSATPVIPGGVLVIPSGSRVVALHREYCVNQLSVGQQDECCPSSGSHEGYLLLSRCADSRQRKKQEKISRYERRLRFLEPSRTILKLLSERARGIVRLQKRCRVHASIT